MLAEFCSNQIKRGFRIRSPKGGVMKCKIYGALVILVLAGSSRVAVAQDNASVAPSVQVNADGQVVKDLEPFTHTVVIPAGSDLASIRLQGVKTVRIPTQTRSTTEAGYCEETAFREPGGSMYCPFVEPEAFTRAYQVTYSYEGPPLASDEYGDRHFTFSVYFRPEELGSAEREVLSRRKSSRAYAAELFTLTTSREPETRRVIDEDNSTFCEGTYVDGLWVQTNPTCKDNVMFKTITAPSDYVTVRVDPAPWSRALASASVE
jgi:hypothetical protein